MCFWWDNRVFPSDRHRLIWLIFALFAALVGSATAVPPVDVSDLVDLAKLTPPPLEEIRYATRYNFTGEALYPFPAAFLRREVATALDAVQRDLAGRGLGLKIYDGYRPLSVQQKMWDLVRDERYVSDPAKNSGRHTRGTAVDVTLVDKRGNELLMPTPFDDFTERAHRGASGIPKAAAAHSLLLEEVMVAHGFVPYPFEWWHFDFHDWEKCPPLDIPFDRLRSPAPSAPPTP